MSNKDRKRKANPPKVDWKALEIVHPHAAGIDIGGREHWVAISPDRDEDPVRCFDCFTGDIEKMADWLSGHGIQSVAMQSTGVYWVPVLEILQQRGMEVYLVNARHTKNLPGRKSDIAECQWLLKLHTFGLLNNSFQPTDEVRTMRTLWRHRCGMVAQASSTIQRMQKVLIEMNIQLSNVLSDLSGFSGMAIVQAILEGKRDPQQLAGLADPQVKASKEVIAKSLQGNWRPELLFLLRQELENLSILEGRDRSLRSAGRAAIAEHDTEGGPGGATTGKTAQGEEGAGQRSEIRREEGTLPDHRRGLEPSGWHRCAGGPNRDCGGRGEPQCIPDGEALCQLAGAVPDERDQQRQGAEPADPEGRQPGQGSIPTSGLDSDSESELSRCAIPAAADSTGGTQGGNRDGPQTGVSLLPAHTGRPPVRGQRGAILRGPLQATTDSCRDP